MDGVMELYDNCFSWCKIRPYRGLGEGFSSEYDKESI
jgi:hypothetical protein